MTTPLMLHSLTEHRTVIFGCLEAVGARSAVEVGSEFGGFTTELAAWAAEHGGTAATIEPFPADAIRRLDGDSEHFTLVEGRSPQALRDIEPADAYVLDGDHAYSVTLEELRTIAEIAGPDRPHPLVLLHDVGWPCARRDLYYDPESLPADAVHPHTWEKAVVPWDPGVVDSGFRGEGNFATALHEGGPRNGVLTAVEDYLGESEADLSYAHVPSVFGLGVVYPRQGEEGRRLSDFLAPYDRSALLARLEENRLVLLMRVIEMQDQQRAQVIEMQDQQRVQEADLRARSRLLMHYADRLAAVEAENAALRLGRLTAGSS